MNEAPAKAKINIEDLIKLGAQDRWFEVVDGEIIEMSPTGFTHNYVAANLYDILRTFTKQQNLGYVGADGLLFVLHNDPESGIRHMRVPDVFFIQRGTAPDFQFDKPFPGAPTLAVEIVSTSEDAETLQNKIHSYFLYGTQEVWTIYPQIKVLHRYQDFKTITVLTAEDKLKAEELFPGLEIPVLDLFAKPDLG
jgi:Uma2 family endonuclease